MKPGKPKRRCCHVGLAGALAMGMALLSVMAQAGTPPVAQGWNMTVAEGSTNPCMLACVLKVGAPTCTLTLVSAPAQGLLSCLSNGVYAPVTVSVAITNAPWFYGASVGWRGTNSFVWKVNDGAMDSNLATNKIVVTSNTPPVAISQVVAVPRGMCTAVTLGTDADSGQMTNSTLTAAPGHGTLRYLDASGAYQPVTVGVPTPTASWIYNADATYTGADWFVWQVNDGIAFSSSGTCTVTVTANLAPLASASSTTITRGNQASITLSPTMYAQNYMDPAVPVKSMFRVISMPANGVLQYTTTNNIRTNVTAGAWLPSLSGSLSVYYVPASSFVGSDVFSWQVTDGFATSGVAVASITVTSRANTTPSGQSVTVVQGSVRQNFSVSYQNNTLASRFNLLSGPANGTLEYISGSYQLLGISNPVYVTTLYYTPRSGFSGSDVATWNVIDAGVTSGTATITFNVTTNKLPSAAGMTNTFGQGINRDYLYLNNSDPDTYQPFTYTLVTPPTNGSLAYFSSSLQSYLVISTNAPVASQYWSYVPFAASFTGTDTFWYTICDGMATSAPVQSKVVIVGNSVPVPNGGSFTTPAGVSAFVQLTYSHASADSSQSLYYMLTTPPAHGTIRYFGSSTPMVPGLMQPFPSTPYFLYNPTPGYTGSDSFGWQMFDGVSASGVATYSITVVNSAPVANNGTFSVGGGSVRAPVALSYTDADASQTHLLTLVTSPINGVLRRKLMGVADSTGVYVPVTAGSSFADTTLYYQPNAGFAGADPFTWTVSDGLSSSGIGIDRITVVANNPPIINKPLVSLACLPNSTNDISGWLGYTHADLGQTMTFTLLTEPANGTILITGAPLHAGGTTLLNTWTYVPNGGYTGSDSFTWTVDDGMVASDPGQFAITVAVSTANNPPVFKSGVKLMDGNQTLALGTRIVNGRIDFAAGSQANSDIHNNNGVVAAPELVDWNNDGLMDMLVGQADGRIALFINHGTKGHPVFNGYTYLATSNGKPIWSWPGGCICTGSNPEAPAPRVVDWNNDGKKDLLLGEWGGMNGVNLFIYFNVGTDDNPVFDAKMSCKLYSASGSDYYPTALPFVADLNGDGIPDLLSGEGIHQNGATIYGNPGSLINLYYATKNDHSPQSIDNATGNSECFNWDVYSPSGSFVSTHPSLTFTSSCPIGARKSVVAADWTGGNGRKDFMVGMQDGSLWFSPNRGTVNFPVFTNGVPLVVGGSNAFVGVNANTNKNDITGLTLNEARLSVGDLDGDGLPDLVVGDNFGNITVFYQYNPNPVAIDQNVLVMLDHPKAITLTAKVDSGHAVVFNVVSNALHGQLTGTAPTVTYTPNGGYTGTDCFCFQANDGPTNSRVATVWLTVRPHAPVTQWSSPVTLSSTAILSMNTPTALPLTATDDGEDPLTYNVVTTPSHGTYTISSKVVTYMPANNYKGPDSFTYKANDGFLDSNITTVNLDICVKAVNFQPASVSAPAGYLADTGALYNVSRGYGWNDTNHTMVVLNANPDPRMDTFASAAASNASTWTCDLPSNGTYYVSFACGFWGSTQGVVWTSALAFQDLVSLQGIAVMTNPASAAVAPSPSVCYAGQIPVTITNGQLTLQAGGGTYATRLDYVEIRSAYQPAGLATFVAEDDTTHGSWRGKYGSDGYVLATGLLCPAGIDLQTTVIRRWDPSFFNLFNLPPYVLSSGVAMDGFRFCDRGGGTSGGTGAWAFPTPDPRALQYPTLDDNNRIAVYWAAAPGKCITNDFNFTDGQMHRVAMYSLGWSSANDSWVQRVDVVDAGDGTLLDSRTLTHFVDGKWLVWDLQGHVKIQVTAVSGGAAPCGFFFGNGAAPSLVVQPLDVAVQTGQFAAFHVIADGNPSTYQWQRSNDGGVTWGDVPGATDDIYAFPTVLADNTAQFRCVVSNASGRASSDPALLTVNGALPAPPVITSPLLVTCSTNDIFTYQIMASNNPTWFDAWMPPAYFSFDPATGIITSPQIAFWVGSFNQGFFKNTGTLHIPIAAGNDGGEDDEILTIIVNPGNAPKVTSALTAIGMVGSPFSYQIIGSQTPTSYFVTNLPAGLTLNTASGLISGAPLWTAAGTTRVMIGAQNANGGGLAYLSLTIQAAPTILAQPVDFSAPVSSQAVFSVTAVGAAPLAYQWMKNGTNISGATAATYVIPAVAYSNAGSYSVQVTNVYNAVVSSSALLTVTASPQAPSISSQPTNLSMGVGSPALFTVTAGGSGPLYYQWQKGGTNIPGAAASSYAIGSVALADAGAYSVVVSNYMGSVTSSSAWLTVSNLMQIWWKLNDAGGSNAMDSSGCNNTGNVQGATVVWTNGLPPQGGLFLQAGSGITNYVIASAVTPASAVPQVFTLAIWFSAADSNGGRLIGFGNTNAGVSGTYDRHLYINNAGKVVFGLYASAVLSIASPLGYAADGSWHHAAASLSPAGMQLYVDGALVASNPNVTGDTRGYPSGGYWRVGWDALSPYPGVGSSAFCGAVCDARVYNRALSADEVAALAANPFDAWRVAHFGFANVAGAGVTDDPLQVGMNNWQKYLLGMDPNDPKSTFKLLQIVPCTGSNGVWWYGGTTNTGHINLFAVEARTNLGGTGWSTKATGLPNNASGTNVWWDTSLPANAPVFYRITTHGNGP